MSKYSADINRDMDPDHVVADVEVTRHPGDYPDAGLTSGTFRHSPLRHESPGRINQARPEDDEGRTTKCCFCIKIDKDRFTTFSALFILFGMVMYVVDIATDLMVAAQYLYRGQKLWSILTFVFVFVPSIVMQGFSFRWFMFDMEEDRNHVDQKFSKNEAKWPWCEWIVLHIFQLGTIQRYWRNLKYGCKSREDPSYLKMMVDEYVDVTMLRLLEAFLESAPQLVLQVYIMVETEEFYWLTACSALMSLGSLCWSLEAYHKVLREATLRLDKEDITYLGIGLRFAWRLFTITARVFAMALFAAVYEWWIFVVAGVHWIAMTLWLIWQGTDFCEGSKHEEMVFDAVIGFIHIFCFFNLLEGRSRFRALFFYAVVFVENTVMLALWYSEQESREQVYGIPALVFVWGGFFVGIFIMMFYYRCFHPSGNVRLCASAKDADPESHSGSDVNVQLQATTSKAKSSKESKSCVRDQPRASTDDIVVVDSSKRMSNQGASIRSTGSDDTDGFTPDDVFSHKRGEADPEIVVPDITPHMITGSEFTDGPARRVNLFSYKSRRNIKHGPSFTL